MRVLGIDPGTRRTGWGVVEVEGTRLRHRGAGTIVAPSEKPLAIRLRTIHDELRLVIAAHEPEAIAVEEIFFAKHANAALKLGHARGIALLAAAQAGLTVHEYPPAIVKRTVVGRGHAGKEQVAKLIAALLALSEPPQHDATDALAVAITHVQAARSSAIVGIRRR